MAVLAAVFSTSLLIVAAIAVDISIAFVSKRQLQTAADAGALAATQVYNGQSRACADLTTDAVLRQQAQQAADRWAEANRPGKVGGTIELSCPADGGLTVRYSVTGSTGTAFAPVFDGPGSITTGRTAAATIEKDSPGGLRPWGICSTLATTSGNVVFVPMEGGSTTGRDDGQVCGDQAPPGGWWVAQCIGQVNGTGQTELAVTNGCAQAYSAVPNQTATMTPTQLYTHLTTSCPARASNSTCLTSDPGNNFHNASDEWQALVGKTIQMPVFCTRTRCSDMAYSGQGNNASYAIQQIATVELCGFKLNPRAASTGWPSTGPCATNNPHNYASSSVAAGGGFFLVIKGLTGGTSPAWQLAEYSESTLTE